MQLDPTIWHRRKIEIIGLGTCLVLTLVFYLAGIYPLIRSVRAQGILQIQLNAEDITAGNLHASHAMMRGRVITVREALDKVSLKLEPTSRINQRVAHVAELAMDSGLKVDQMQPGLPTSGQRYQMVPITLMGTGSYKTCMVFLHRIRQVFPDTGVSSLQLSGNPSAPSTQATFRINLSWYALPPMPTGGE